MGYSYVGDIGTQIVVDTGEDLSSATVTQIKIKPPSGSTMTKTASVYETTKLLYTITTGDLATAGNYIVQAYVEMGGGKWHGDPAQFHVAALKV